MALDQEDMAPNRETTEPNRRPRDGRITETEAIRLKGREARRRNYEKRVEKQRLAAFATGEQYLKQRRQDEGFIREAFRQAKEAAAIGDVPIRCVIVCRDRIIARGYNRRSVDKSMLSHAKIISIREACEKMGGWRLEDYTMYMTLESYPMCTGVIVQARISRVAVECMNPRTGCVGSVLDMLRMPGFNHQAEVAEGVLEQEYSKLMSDFFQNLRERKKQFSYCSDARRHIFLNEKPG